MSYYKKVGICTAILSTTIIAVAALWWLSRTEFYFSSPSIIDNLDHLPTLSVLFFENYDSMWLVVAPVFVWSAILVFRKTTTLDDIALLAAWATLGVAACASATLLAMYLCNQTLVFRFQDRL